MSYNIEAREANGPITAVVGNLVGIKSDNCAEQILRALIHAGYEVTVKENREREKVEQAQGGCTAHSGMAAALGVSPGFQTPQEGRPFER